MEFKSPHILGADRASRPLDVRQKAEECRQLAGTSLSTATREKFLDLAQSYDALADELECKEERVVNPSP